MTVRPLGDWSLDFLALFAGSRFRPGSTHGAQFAAVAEEIRALQAALALARGEPVAGRVPADVLPEPAPCGCPSPSPT
jgi:hypothetical protein